jgi:hypothetical protein
MNLPPFLHRWANWTAFVACWITTQPLRIDAQEAPASAPARPAETADPASEDPPTNTVTIETAATANPSARPIDTNALVTAKATTAPMALTYESFKLIADRNIFDQNREPRVARSNRGARNAEGRRTPRIESFALVGTMSYAKGTFAFFDGSSTQYKKTLKVGDSIGAYRVTDVDQYQVKLAGDKLEVKLKVGQQLRREDEGEWQLSARSAEPAASNSSGAGDVSSSSNSSSTAPSGSSDSGGTSDLVKRLMQQREKELNK